jgi:hypothetical protein
MGLESRVKRLEEQTTKNINPVLIIHGEEIPPDVDRSKYDVIILDNIPKPEEVFHSEK